MDKKEFKEFVIKSAKKYLSENEDLSRAEVLDEKKKTLKVPELPKFTKPNSTKGNVNKLPEAPKLEKEPKVPETLSIGESFSPEKIKILAEEMKKVNKKMDLRNPLINPELFDIISEEKNIVKEDQKGRWQNLYSYNIPKDDNR